MSYLSMLEKKPKPHAVCIPYPAQGHITPLLKLAKLLHFTGFHITFVNTEFNHRRLLKSRGPHSLDGIPSFRFETIPDGLPDSDVDATQDTPTLCDSLRKNCLAPFRNLLSKLKNTTLEEDVPPVSCIVSDGVMSFTLLAAKELGIPEVLFWTISASAFTCYLHFVQLIHKGFFPLKDSIYGFSETTINSIPGIKEMRLKDLPGFFRTIDPNDIMIQVLKEECGRANQGAAIILNTFDALEHDVLDALSSILPPIYTIGPLNLLLNHVIDDKDYLDTIGSNLWKEERECLKWLDTHKPNSVVYVNFGSITVMTSEQLIEFAWGLANTNQPFLWVIRPDLVAGENAVLPPEFGSETKNRGMMSSWCPQEEVLAHSAVGGFLTHSGWNSTIESLSNGVPMICWPFFSEQPTNCRFCCNEWGVGLEIEGDVKRDRVEGLVRELMEGHKGKELARKALEWKKLGQDATSNTDGSSFLNYHKVVQVLLSENLQSN